MAIIWAIGAVINFCLQSVAGTRRNFIIIKRTVIVTKIYSGVIPVTFYRSLCINEVIIIRIIYEKYFSTLNLWGMGILFEDSYAMGFKSEGARGVIQIRIIVNTYYRWKKTSPDNKGKQQKINH